jgi:hypothetical protein
VLSEFKVPYTGTSVANFNMDSLLGKHLTSPLVISDLSFPDEVPDGLLTLLSHLLKLDSVSPLRTPNYGSECINDRS